MATQKQKNPICFIGHFMADYDYGLLGCLYAPYLALSLDFDYLDFDLNRIYKCNWCEENKKLPEKKHEYLKQ